MTDTPRTDALTENARTMAEVLDAHEAMERDVEKLRGALYSIAYASRSYGDAKARAIAALEATECPGTPSTIYAETQRDKRNNGDTQQ